MMVPLLVVLVLAQQGTAQELQFPYQVFLQRDSLARVLLRYDACAWRTSDALLAQDRASLPRLGPEWLCYQRAGHWNAVYGRFDDAKDRYDIVVHFVMQDTLAVHSTEPLDTSGISASTRAIRHGHALLPADFDSSGFRFNTYVLPTRSGLDVWFLPAWQPTGVVVFGGEAQYSFDSTGRSLRDQHVIEGPLRWFRPDSTVAFRLDSNSPDDVPTVGNLFFYYLTRRHFDRIRIKTAKYSSSMVPTDSGEVWVHVILPP
ncbi:MAG TPA: hypothetical protein VGQ29_10750 [Gemmatimonadales bacterium]|jgi:hypothetical protein|nr:hypothetical protein [Gemmatimonadales bacterium]